MVEGKLEMGDLAGSETGGRRRNKGTCFAKGNLVEAVAKFDGAIDGEHDFVARVQDVALQNLDFLIQKIFRLLHGQIADSHVGSVRLLRGTGSQWQRALRSGALRRFEKEKVSADRKKDDNKRNDNLPAGGAARVLRRRLRRIK